MIRNIRYLRIWSKLNTPKDKALKVKYIIRHGDKNIIKLDSEEEFSDSLESSYIESLNDYDFN